MLEILVIAENTFVEAEDFNYDDLVQHALNAEILRLTINGWLVRISSMLLLIMVKFILLFIKGFTLCYFVSCIFDL